MRKSFVQICGVLVLSTFALGCGGDEMGPATTTPEGPSEEQMQDYMKESMQRGGMNVEIPEPEKKEEEPAKEEAEDTGEAKETE